MDAAMTLHIRVTHLTKCHELSIESGCFISLRVSKELSAFHSNFGNDVALSNATIGGGRIS